MAKTKTEIKNAYIFAELIYTLKVRTGNVPWQNVQEIMHERAPEFGGNHIAYWWLQLRESTKRRYSYIIANLYDYIVNDIPYECSETDKYLLATYDAYLSAPEWVK